MLGRRRSRVKDCGAPPNLARCWLRFRESPRAGDPAVATCAARRAPSDDCDQRHGVHGPTVADGAEDAGAIGYCLAPRLRPRLRAALLPGTARTHVAAPLSTSRAATVHPRRCTAVTAASQSLAGRCGHARSTGAPESARTCARRLGPLGRRRAHAALFRDPVRAVAARSPRADGKRLVGLRRIGQRAVAGFAGTDGAWCRGAQEVCAERTCSALALELVNVSERDSPPPLRILPIIPRACIERESL